MQKRQTLKKTGIIIFLILVIIVAIFVFKNRSKSQALQAEIAQGLDVVRRLEAADVSAIEAAITEAEDETRQSENGEKTLEARFANAMVLGDSEAVSLSHYGILSELQVAAQVSVGIRHADEHIDTAIGMNPSVVFMTYGLNDLGIYSSGEEFANVYAEKIQRLQKGLPSAKIYVTSIFPTTKAAIERQPYLANSAAFSEALCEKTKKLDVTFIDCTSIIEDKYYEPDGEHFVSEFYQIWAQLLADSAGL